MDLSTYQSEALVTAAPQSDPKLRLAIVGLGLSGEAGEVLHHLGTPRENLKQWTGLLVKELGDVMWYCAEGATIVAADLGALHLVPVAPAVRTGHAMADLLVIRSCLLADYIKKVVGHGHSLDSDRLLTDIAAVVSLVSAIAAKFGTTLEDVCAANVTKLRARYPGGFSREGSVNRTA